MSGGLFFLGTLSLESLPYLQVTISNDFARFLLQPTPLDLPGFAFELVLFQHEIFLLLMALIESAATFSI